MKTYKKDKELLRRYLARYVFKYGVHNLSDMLNYPKKYTLDYLLEEAKEN